jgi:hypothetical protein
VTAAVVAATRWPFRSHALFSWDSANFALAMARIDIAAHRPHPPGYLGYVLAGRALNGLVHDPNTSLVIWNIVVTAIAAIVVGRWAWDLAEGQSHQISQAVAAGAVFITSPLLWFYGEVAEIYPSELLVTLLVAFAAWRTLHGHHASIVWCAVGMALAAAFKVTAAILIAPLTLYAWTRAPAADQRRSALAAAILLGGVGAVFLVLQPDLVAIIWRQFTVSTSGTRVIGGETGLLRALNINARDTFTAAASALGVVNLVALGVWIAIDRRLPTALGRRVAGLWLTPWLLLVLFVHIGRRGYILPLLPLAALVIAGFYTRQRRNLAILLVSLQVAANVFQFVWLAPPPRSAVGGTALYRDKTLLERALSDLDAVTFPTALTIEKSDERAAALAALVTRTCPSGDPVIVAEADWRRVLWYFQNATAINTSGRDVLFTGIHTNATSLPASGVTLATRCPVIWLAGDTGEPGSFTPKDARPVPGVGAITDPATLVVTPTAIDRR